MAVQESFIKLKGKVGDLTFYQTKDGYRVRESKSSLTANRVANDPSFHLTRLNSQEFGRAGRYAKVLRDLFQKAVRTVADRRMSRRLSQHMLQVMKADDVHPRGERTLLAGNVGLLQGFQFNAGANFHNVFRPGHWGHINRDTGVLSLVTEAFVPTEDLHVAPSATHFQVFAAGAIVDFANNGRPADIPLNPDGSPPDPEEKGLLNIQRTEILPINDALLPSITLQCEVLEDRSEPLFLVAGIRFFAATNGFFDPVSDSSYKSAALLSTDMP